MFNISIVTLNYNSTSTTITLIESILSKTRDLNFEIIVVDNGSDEENYFQLFDYIKQLNNPNIKVVRSHINTGFGAGNMIGYANCSSSNYVAFINNDVEFIDDVLYTLALYLDNHHDVAVISPQSVNQNNDFVPTIDHFASWQREIFTRKFLEFVNPKRFPKRKKIYSEPVEADFVAGSFMLIRRSDFNLIGGFDTNLFLYYEETDLSRRFRKLNKKTILYPKLKYKHLHGFSTEKSLRIKLEQKISLFYVIRKHQGWLAYKLLLIYFGIKYFFSMFLSPKKWKLFSAVLLGMPIHMSLKNKQKIEFLNR